MKYLFQNGDYTYNIPEQYATPNMSTRYCRLIKQNNLHNISMNHLCADCNKQESLKVLELSNFEPKSERQYDAEMKKFKEYLEKRYPLCSKCKLTVQTVLSKQALWLTRYKMLLFRQKPLKMLIGVSIHFSVALYEEILYTIRWFINMHNYYNE